ncbi:MAG: ABC transporter ATP-binding protein [Kiritimatiellae bacterium]|nr:ABC transporter ATP-binding protein [Kiritimatiellia bacterium]
MADLVTIENLTVSFDTDEGRLKAVDDVSLSIRKGEALGLVGESGCGKSVTAMSMLRLIPAPPGRIEAGRVLFRGRDLLSMPLDELRGIRGEKISMIFQEPMTALSPLHRIGRQLTETLHLHRQVADAAARRTAEEWLRKVGIADAHEVLYAYPFQLSGGMRQRVMIAMALMLGPDLIMADEPTTALDVTIQAQIFELMNAMRTGETALLLITHDMGVIWEMCDRVAVMYASELVELAVKAELFARPLHPYTEALLDSMPSLAAGQPRLKAIKGQVPSPLAYPAGCRFAERCPRAFDRCRREHPPLYELPGGRRSACFLREPAP